jgi:hypothetical protein
VATWPSVRRPLAPFVDEDCHSGGYRRIRNGLFRLSPLPANDRRSAQLLTPALLHMDCGRRRGDRAGDRTASHDDRKLRPPRKISASTSSPAAPRPVERRANATAMVAHPAKTLVAAPRRRAESGCLLATRGAMPRSGPPPASPSRRCPRAATRSALGRDRSDARARRTRTQLRALQRRAHHAHDDLSLATAPANSCDAAIDRKVRLQPEAERGAASATIDYSIR